MERGQPAYLLEVEPLDLGSDVKAVGFALVEPESHEPIRGGHAAQMWSAALATLAGDEPWALDFFSHRERLREFCRRHEISYREAANRCVVIAAPDTARLAALLERFEGETFGVRAGELVRSGDAALEGDLARRGVDAYHHVFTNCFFCAVCDFENGSLILLTNRLWASEVIRCVRPVPDRFRVAVARSQ